MSRWSVTEEEEDTGLDYNSRDQNKKKLKEYGVINTPDLVDNKIGIRKEVRTKLDDIYIDSKDLLEKPEGKENIPYDTDDPGTLQMVLQRKANAKRNEQEYKDWLKERKEWDRF